LVKHPNDPAWNDANHALVGPKGLSMVTLNYIAVVTFLFYARLLVKKVEM